MVWYISISIPETLCIYRNLSCLSVAPSLGCSSTALRAGVSAEMRKQLEHRSLNLFEAQFDCSTVRLSGMGWPSCWDDRKFIRSHESVWHIPFIIFIKHGEMPWKTGKEFFSWYYGRMPLGFAFKHEMLMISRNDQLVDLLFLPVNQLIDRKIMVNCMPNRWKFL